MAKIAKPDTVLEHIVVLGFLGEFSFTCTYTLAITFETLSDIPGIKSLIYLMYPRQFNGSHGLTSSAGRDQTISHMIEKAFQHHKDKTNERKIHPNIRSSHGLEAS